MLAVQFARWNSWPSIHTMFAMLPLHQGFSNFLKWGPTLPKSRRFATQDDVTFKFTRFYNCNFKHFLIIVYF